MVYSPLEHWAQTIRWLCDEVYPQAQKIVLVQDNLNTHTAASLYEAFSPQEGQDLQRWFEEQDSTRTKCATL